MPSKPRDARKGSRHPTVRLSHPVHRARHARLLPARPFPVIARLDATIAYLAQALLDFDDTTSLDQRRVKAMLILANPTQAVHLLRAYTTWRANQNHTPADREMPAMPDPDLDGKQQFNPADVSPTCTCGSGDGAPITGPGDASPGPSNNPIIDEADLLPVIRLFVHLTQTTLGNGCTGVARIEGQPPISAHWVQHHLGGARVTVTPVIDLTNQIPVDTWEIPQRHRHAVHLLTPADTYPYATNTTRGKQIDHTIPYTPTSPPGQSRIGNYGPMTALHHRLKTHGDWHVVQPFPGIYLWQDPTRTATYLIDHTGTRRLEAG